MPGAIWSGRQAWSEAASVRSGCISWQDRHENLPPLKQGEAWVPLSSRPVTRTWPSPQKLSPKGWGLVSSRAARSSG